VSPGGGVMRTLSSTVAKLPGLCSVLSLWQIAETIRSIRFMRGLPPQ
jgi:hypothetical protein